MDLEMTFADQDVITKLTEGLIRTVFQEVRTLYLMFFVHDTVFIITMSCQCICLMTMACRYHVHTKRFYLNLL